MVIFPIQHVEDFIFIFSWYNLISDGSIWPDDIHLSLFFPWSKNISPSIIHEIFLTKFFLPRFLLSYFPFCSKTTKTIFWESWNKRLFSFPISLSLSPSRCVDVGEILPSISRV